MTLHHRSITPIIRGIYFLYLPAYSKVQIFLLTSELQYDGYIKIYFHSTFSNICHIRLIEEHLSPALRYCRNQALSNCDYIIPFIEVTVKSSESNCPTTLSTLKCVYLHVIYIVYGLSIYTTNMIIIDHHPASASSSSSSFFFLLSLCLLSSLSFSRLQ